MNNEIKKVILLKYGEVVLKGLNRKHFEAILEKDAVRRLKNCGNYEVKSAQSTMYVTPLDDEALGENIYLGILESAERYVWITTPYLIIDEQMTEALCRAVKSGVDVRIVTPGIPDKKLVNETTKSYYPILIENGVKIYEYKPGFIHAKTFLCDDEIATVGSVNLDYRSLYLHFECGVWMYKTECIADIKSDFLHIFEESEEITKPSRSFIRQFFRGILELIAPLL